MSKVLVMTVPAAAEEDLFVIRDYVQECLRLGVLIVGKGVSWEVADIPALGSVAVEAAQEPWTERADTAADGEDIVPPEPSFMGPRAEEKRSIFNRLTAYRKAHGLGSFDPLIAASDGRLGDSVIHMAFSGEKLDMETWRLIGKALDSAGG